MIKTVNIVTQTADNANYLFFAEFFKLCGIFPVQTQGRPFSQTVYAEDGFRSDPDRVLDIRQKYRWTDLKADNRQEKEKTLLREGLQSIIRNDDDLCSFSVDALIEAYVESDLFHQCVMAEFFYSPSLKAIRICRDRFAKAVSILNEKDVKCAGPWHTHFKLSCQIKVNTLSIKLDLNRPHKTEDLLAESIRLYEDGFKPGYLLAGNISNSDWKYYTLNRAFFEDSLGIDSFWDSYAFYKLGQYYERAEEDPEMALSYYKKASSLAPWDYRFLYKKAIQNLSFGDAGKAIRCIQRIENILTNQLIKKDLTPVQIEYLFKSYAKLAEIYCTRFRDPAMVRLTNKSIAALIEMIEDDVFMKQFYCDNPERAEKERKLLKANYLKYME